MEVLEKDVLLHHTDSTHEKYLDLLKSAEIEVSEQRCLYTDFLQNSFPYLYMNVYAFMHIATDIMKWERDDALSLFRWVFIDVESLSQCIYHWLIIKHVLKDLLMYMDVAPCLFKIIY